MDLIALSIESGYKMMFRYSDHHLLQIEDIIILQVQVNALFQLIISQHQLAKFLQNQSLVLCHYLLILVNLLINLHLIIQRLL